jgi:hypothetical protein
MSTLVGAPVGGGDWPTATADKPTQNKMPLRMIDWQTKKK